MKIEAVEGIGSVFGAKLSDAGISTTNTLLKVAGSKKGRQGLAEKTGISETRILEWVNRADMMRVKGIGEEYSDLLEAAGVDTVKELRNRNPENLYNALAAKNAEKKLVRRVPSLSEVTGWIENAKTLEPMVTY